MTRPTRLKLLWVVLVGAIVSGTAALAASLRLAPGQVLAIVLLFLVPGRVQGVLYRRLFRGIRLLPERPADAEREFLAFLDELRARPWKRYALWLAWTVYTTRADAMAWNNVGTARLRRSDLAGAREAYEEALRLDPLYPLPHMGLAAVAAVEEPAAVAGHVAAARALGYGGGTTDQLVRRGQTLLASVEGRGGDPP